MKVYFIGAGPGDPELITVKGQRLIQEADLVLYAGSLVPKAIIAQAKPGARVVDSAPLNLEETHALLLETVQNGGMAARVHTGDPGLYGAIREQIELLERDNVSYEVTPGVTSAFAAAASESLSVTVPEVTQTMIITRAKGRTPVPESESIEKLAAVGCSMAVYLSAGDPEALAASLRKGGLPGDTPVLVAHRLGWPGEERIMSSIEKFPALVLERKLTRQTVFLILPGENPANKDRAQRSKLYDAGFSHGYRSSP